MHKKWHYWAAVLVSWLCLAAAQADTAAQPDDKVLTNAAGTPFPTFNSCLPVDYPSDSIASGIGFNRYYRAVAMFKSDTIPANQSDLFGSPAPNQDNTEAECVDPTSYTDPFTYTDSATQAVTTINKPRFVPPAANSPDIMHCPTGKVPRCFIPTEDIKLYYADLDDIHNWTISGKLNYYGIKRDENHATTLLKDGDYSSDTFLKVENEADRICVFGYTIFGWKRVGCKQLHVPPTAQVVHDCYIDRSCYTDSVLYSKTIIPISSLVVQCARATINKVINGDPTCNYTTFLNNVRTQLRRAVMAALTLYVMVFAIKVMLASNVPAPKEVFSFMIKMVLVIYFSIGFSVGTTTYTTLHQQTDTIHSDNMPVMVATPASGQYLPPLNSDDARAYAQVANNILSCISSNGGPTLTDGSSLQDYQNMVGIVQQLQGVTSGYMASGYQKSCWPQSNYSSSTSGLTASSYDAAVYYLNLKMNSKFPSSTTSTIQSTTNNVSGTQNLSLLLPPSSNTYQTPTDAMLAGYQTYYNTYRYTSTCPTQAGILTLLRSLSTSQQSAAYQDQLTSCLNLAANNPDSCNNATFQLYYPDLNKTVCQQAAAVLNYYINQAPVPTTLTINSYTQTPLTQSGDIPVFTDTQVPHTTYTNSNGVSDIYTLFSTLSTSLANLFIAGSSQGLCSFPVASYANGHADLAVWDALDCRIAYYMGMVDASGSAGNTVTMPRSFPLVLSMIFGGLFAMLNMNVWFAIIMMIVGILVLQAVLWAVHSFIIATFALSLMVFLAPLFVPMALFKVTESNFKGWLKLVFAYSLQPTLLIAFLGFMMLVYDGIIYGDCEFEIIDVAAWQGSQRNVYFFAIKPLPAMTAAEVDQDKCASSFGYQVAYNPFTGLSNTTAGFINVATFNNPGAIAKLFIAIMWVLFFAFVFYNFVKIMGGLAADLVGGSAIGGMAVSANLAVDTAIQVVKMVADKYTGGAASKAAEGVEKMGKGGDDGAKRS